MKLLGLTLLCAAASFAQSSLNIVTSILPQGSAGANYGPVSLQAQGGTPPYSWSLSSGSFPPGLLLNASTGTITGTASPAASGTYTFLLTVTDARFTSFSRSVSITINGTGTGSSRVSITSPGTLPSGTVGQSYTQTLTAAGTPPYRWTAAQIPAGLTLDATTGILSGTPTTAGAFSLAVQVTDAAQTSATATLGLTINPAPVTITTVSPLFTGTVGVAYAQTFSATGGKPPYSWSIVSGSTGGLTLDPNSGVLQGTPQNAGTFAFTVQVLDSSRIAATQNFSVTVNAPALVITVVAQPVTGAVGVAYNQKLPVVVNGGTQPITWTLAAGAVPGLVFDPTTLNLSGTPTTAGSFDLTLQANDAAGLTARRTVTIPIAAAALGISTARQLPDIALNSSYSQTLAATGGAPPYTWSATGLPGGLTLNPTTGAISGVASVAGNFAIAISVTDSALSRFTDRFTLNVILPAVPSVKFTGLPPVADPAKQFTLQADLGGTYPAIVTGQAILTFSPDSGPADRTVVFASGGTTLNFTVPLGSTDLQFDSTFAVQTGTVAGTLTVTLRLQAGGIDITPSPAPSLTAQVNRAAPVVSDVQVTRSGGGISLAVTGYSTSREITQAVFAFSAASGQSLQSSASSITVDVGSLFTTWFQSSNNSPYGSQFVFTQPFTIQGDANSVIPVSVTLTNREGSATFQIK